jgi:hypothetical protein
MRESPNDLPDKSFLNQVECKFSCERPAALRRWGVTLCMVEIVLFQGSIDISASQRGS